MSGKQNERFSLDGVWSLTHCTLEKASSAIPAGLPDTISACVPGDVHLDLMAIGLLPDPLVRDNFKQCRWIGEQEWIYEKTFTGNFAPGTRHELVFEGLIYVAEVFLNGTFIGGHKTMHRPLRLDVSAQLKDGTENVITVKLRAFDLRELNTPVIGWWSGWDAAICDTDLCLKRGAGRKADYSYGWDWTQGLPICGIWRSVSIESTSSYRIVHEYYRTENNGTVECTFELNSALSVMTSAVCTLDLRRKGNAVVLASKHHEITIGPGWMEYRMSVQIEAPELWYPAGCGHQPLYEGEITINGSGEDVTRTTVFAFRSVTIEETKYSDIQGSYRLIVNGSPVFAKGANWIPSDIIPARVTRDHLRRLLRLTIDGGMNYLRFWGGGYYEDDYFYELCDEYGIMLWHDFMFGGPEIPEFDPIFREECRREARTQLLRLRNHPSIVVWCGSNETDDMYKRAMPRIRPNGEYYGWTIFHRDFPMIVAELCPSIPYVPSCPTPGRFRPENSRLNDPGFGTCHTNMVGQYSSDAEFDTRGVVPTFINEIYGVSPGPESSWCRYLSEKDLNHYCNPILSAHSVLDLQRNDEWSQFFNDLSFHHTTRRFDLPLREVFSYYNETHAELVKRYVEFLRRNRKFSGGIGLWMLNCAFTMMDWSLIDYYGTPKSAWYAATRAFKDVLPVIAVYDERIDFHVSNDTLQTVTGSLACTVCRFDGTVLKEAITEVAVMPDASLLAVSLDRTLIPRLAPEECVILAEYQTTDGRRWCNNRFFVSPKYRRLPNTEITVHAHPENPAVFILSSSCLACRVVLSPYDSDNYPDDNFFDLYPGRAKTVTFRRSLNGAFPEISWLNQPSRKPYIAGIEKNSTGPEEWTVELYNPLPETVTVPVRLEALRCTGQVPDTVTVPGLGQKLFTVILQPEVFQAHPCVNPVTLQVGNQAVMEAVTSFRPQGLYNGCLRLVNISEKTQSYASTTYTGIRFNGEVYRNTMPCMEVAPHGTYHYDFSPPDDVLPFTTGLFRDGRRIMNFWEDKIPVASFWPQLPLTPFDGQTVRVFPSQQFEPDLLREGCGVLIETGRHTALLQPDSALNITAALFLHHHGKHLIVSILVRGIPFRQVYFEEAVWQGTCVELLLGYEDGAEFRDYSLALTGKGPQLCLRRGSKGFVRGVYTDYGDMTILTSGVEDITYYRLTLDHVLAGLPELLARGRFRIALTLRTPDKNGLLIFNGMSIGCRCNNAGIAEIVS